MFYCKSLIRLRRASAGHVTQLEDPVENGEMDTSGSACKVKSFQLLSISDWGTVCHLRFLTIFHPKHMESFIF